MTYTPRIVVIDDDEAVRDALENLLGALGFSVRTFASADDFIDEDGATGAACLITDVQMPGMSGLELMAHLTRNGVSLPVILVSAHGHAALRSRALRDGAVAWLDKPVRQERLLETIDYAMS